MSRRRTGRCHRSRRRRSCSHRPTCPRPRRCLQARRSGCAKPAESARNPGRVAGTECSRAADSRDFAGGSSGHIRRGSRYRAGWRARRLMAGSALAIAQGLRKQQRSRRGEARRSPWPGPPGSRGVWRTCATRCPAPSSGTTARSDGRILTGADPARRAPPAQTRVWPPWEFPECREGRFRREGEGRGTTDGV